MSDIKERLLLYLEQKDIKQAEFCRNLGVSKAYITSMRKSLSPDKLQKISSLFPDLNIAWLLTGEGEMIKDGTEPVVRIVDAEIPADETGNYKMVPIVHIDSVGGMHSGNDILTPEYIERYIPMTGAREDDVAIYQSGNSMAPAIPSGALLLIREVESWREYIGYGDVFVMLLSDERRITKEIRRYADDPQNYFWCVSYNPDVADEELPKSLVRRVWKVIKVLIDKGW